MSLDIFQVIFKPSLLFCVGRVWGALLCPRTGCNSLISLSATAHALKILLETLFSRQTASLVQRCYHIFSGLNDYNTNDYNKNYT